MTSHDWKLTPVVTKVEIWGDIKVVSQNSAPGVYESYTCFRCGDTAHINYYQYVSMGGKSIKTKQHSSNWNSDCDEIIIEKVHDS